MRALSGVNTSGGRTFITLSKAPVRAEQEAVLAQPVQDDGILAHRRERRPVAHEFDAPEEAVATQVADRRVLRGSARARWVARLPAASVLLDTLASSTSSTAMPTAADTGLPPKVLK